MIRQPMDNETLFEAIVRGLEAPSDSEAPVNVLGSIRGRYALAVRNAVAEWLGRGGNLQDEARQEIESKMCEPRGLPYAAHVIPLGETKCSVNDCGFVATHN